MAFNQLDRRKRSTSPTSAVKPKTAEVGLVCVHVAPWTDSQAPIDFGIRVMRYFADILNAGAFVAAGAFDGIRMP